MLAKIFLFLLVLCRSSYDIKLSAVNRGMDNQPCDSMGQISAQGFLEEIFEQDALWWDNKGNVAEDECKLTKLGKFVTKIHDHYRVLEPEHSLKLFSQSCSDARSSEIVLPSISTNGSESEQDESRTACDGPLEPLSKSDPRTIMQRRVKHASGDSLQGSLRQRQSFMQDSLALGRSPQQRGSIGSLESLQASERSPRYRVSSQVTNWNLYRSALLCCNYPVLVRAQENSDEGASQLDILPKKDENRSVPEYLDMYLRNIFRISKRMHHQYRALGDGKQSKREKLEQNLRQQLKLSETDSNPYYNFRNFQSTTDYKKWQDQERREISKLLDNKIPAFRGRYRPETSSRNRCEEYRELLKMAMVYDVECSIRNSESRGKNTKGCDHSSTGSESDASASSCCNEILSKWGRRLLGEYATRYRVCVTSQICFYIEAVEECLNDDVLQFNSATCRSLRLKLVVLNSLIEDGRPLCISETDSIIAVTGRFIERVRQLVITLLTEWLPTTEQLRHCLELAGACFQTRDILEGNDASEWPECLSKWFEEATVEKYHSCKTPDFKAIPEAVLFAVEHAVDVMKLMQKRDQNSEQANYEVVFSKYISNFPQAASYGLYDAVMADVKLLAKALPWIKSAPSVRNKSDSLELVDIALAYKLSEFDNLVKIREIDASKENRHERTFSWRKAYHRLAMHWLDILSCHMRSQVVSVVERDLFRCPEEIDKKFDESHDSVDTSSRPLSSRVRLGSLVERENQLERDLNISCSQTNLEVVEKQDDCQTLPKRDEPKELRPKHPIRQTTGGQDGHKSTEDNFPGNRDQAVPCILISYKPIDENISERPSVGDEEQNSGSASFHSCGTPTESSNNLPKFQYDSDTSTQSFSSAVSNNTVDSSDISASLSDGESSDLPQLVSAPTEDSVTNGCSKSFESLCSHGSDQEEKDAAVCNVSSSLIDCAAIISRFLHIVQNIVSTVYSLPFVDDHSSCMEASSLGVMKERFLQKALEATCCVVSQYAINLLNKDLPSLPMDVVSQFINRRILKQVEKGKTNKTLPRRRQRATESHSSFSESRLWDDDTAKKVILRVNNLLVLKHGLAVIWKRLEGLTQHPPQFHNEHRHSGFSNETFVPSSGGDRFSSGTDRNQFDGSSDESPRTSGSNKTAIFRGSTEYNNDNNSDDNSDNIQLNATIYESEPVYENLNAVHQIDGLQRSPSSTSSAEDQSSNAHIYENVSLTSASWIIVDGSASEDYEEEPKDPMIKCAFDYLKEATDMHLHDCITGITGILAIHANNWFVVGFKSVLNSRPTDQCDYDRVCSQLEILLDIFMKWTHKEGLDFLHKSLWKLIIQDVQDEIISLKQVDNSQSRDRAERIRKLFNRVIDAWYRHPSEPNDRDLEQLTQPIRASLTLLELYSMQTDSLIGIFDQCRREGDTDLDHTEDIAVQCMRRLQENKSFSGQTLRDTLINILNKNRQGPVGEDVCSEADELCQEMLNRRLIKFAFKATLNERLPDVIPCEESRHGADGRGPRSESFLTGSSEESSIETVESYSSESGRAAFHCDSNYFYQFINRLRWSIIDDIRVATNTSAMHEDSFFLNLIRTRSQNDRDARSYLLENGFLQRGCAASCLCSLLQPFFCLC